jgi:hypothetical protein
MKGPPNFDRFNAQPVWLCPSPAGSPIKLTHIAAAGSYLIEDGWGFLMEVSINTTASSGSLTLYDGLDATGNVMAVIDVTKNNPSASNNTPWPFNTGLFVVLSGGADVTILNWG